MSLTILVLFKFVQLMLELARGIFREQNSLERLVRKIMHEAQDLLQCERCVVYLIERCKSVRHSFSSQVQ